MAAAELLVLDAPGDDATRVDPDGEVGVGHELDAAPAKLANCRRVAAMPGRDRRLAEGWNEDTAAT